MIVITKMNEMIEKETDTTYRPTGKLGIIDIRNIAGQSKPDKDETKLDQHKRESKLMRCSPHSAMIRIGKEDVYITFRKMFTFKAVIFCSSQTVH